MLSCKHSHKCSCSLSLDDSTTRACSLPIALSPRSSSSPSAVESSASSNSDNGLQGSTGRACRFELLFMHVMLAAKDTRFSRHPDVFPATRSPVAVGNELLRSTFAQRCSRRAFARPPNCIDNDFRTTSPAKALGGEPRFLFEGSVPRLMDLRTICAMDCRVPESTQCLVTLKAASCFWRCSNKTTFAEAALYNKEREYLQEASISMRLSRSRTASTPSAPVKKGWMSTSIMLTRWFLSFVSIRWQTSASKGSKSQTDCGTLTGMFGCASHLRNSVTPPMSSSFGSSMGRTVSNSQTQRPRLHTSRCRETSSMSAPATSCSAISGAVYSAV
mmetsp:Transcript_29763/g.81580  ORF Transcript_29763/g.81580 Transcript_29763/m.81580 type:complete len:331 (+) Transcript_29763:154-1146(+)